jgi:hypothetical protein
LLLSLVSPGMKLLVLLGQLLVLHPDLPPQPILLVAKVGILLPKLLDQCRLVSRPVGVWSLLGRVWSLD